MDDLLKTIKESCQIPGAPGFEHRIVNWLAERFRPHSDRVEIDAMGNLYAYRQSSVPGPTLMISAHSDEIGAVVRAIDPSGFLRFAKLGGLLDSMLPGRKVMVAGRLGVVGVKAGHAQSENERNQVPGYTRQYIDVGADSAEEVAQLGIGLGDPITYISDVESLSNPNRFVGKALDNRLGCIALLALFQSRPDITSGSLCATVTVQEEIGLRGAQVAANHVRPTCALVVDTVPCGDTPDMDREYGLPIGIGRGPVLRLVSRSDIMHLGMRRLLETTLVEEGIAYQVLVHEQSGTDAGAIHLQQEGIPTGVITIPRRYAHSPVEMGDIRDVRSVIRLLQACVARIARLPEYVSFMQP